MTATSHTDATAAERGQTLPMVIAFMLVLLLFAGLVIDIGNAWRAHEALQASTDASATAAAGQLTTAGHGERAEPGGRLR